MINRSRKPDVVTRDCGSITPGPWELIKRQDRNYPLHIAADGISVAVIPLDVSLETSLQRDLANARLIASAPALLEALELTLRAYRGARPQIFGTDSVEEAARAAIARAKGIKS